MCKANPQVCLESVTDHKAVEVLCCNICTFITRYHKGIDRKSKWGILS